MANNVYELPSIGQGIKWMLIAVADDATVQAHSKTLLPYDLPLHVREADTVPDFGHSLVGIKPFADAGFISVFHPHDEGVTIHRREDV